LLITNHTNILVVTLSIWFSCTLTENKNFYDLFTVLIAYAKQNTSYWHRRSQKFLLEGVSKYFGFAFFPFASTVGAYNRRLSCSKNSETRFSFAYIFSDKIIQKITKKLSFSSLRFIYNKLFITSTARAILVL